MIGHSSEDMPTKNPVLSLTLEPVAFNLWVRNLTAEPLDVTALARRRPLSLSQTTNFRLSKTERAADDNAKVDENGEKFSKRVENTEGKREIARYEQFLLFPQCFQKTYNADT